MKINSFCEKCGEKLILVGRYKGTYSRNTVYFSPFDGKAIHYENWKCPNSKWFNSHADNYYNDYGN